MISRSKIVLINWTKYGYITTGPSLGREEGDMREPINAVLYDDYS